MDKVARILVVDDDSAMREMLTALLEDRGFEVECASTSEEALERARCTTFDTIVSDVQMEGNDGYWLVRALRGSAVPTPVILMSSFGGRSAPQDALAAGAFGYLEKPFPSAGLLDAVDRILSGRPLLRPPATSES